MIRGRPLVECDDLSNCRDFEGILTKVSKNTLILLGGELRRGEEARIVRPCITGGVITVRVICRGCENNEDVSASSSSSMRARVFEVGEGDDEKCRGFRDSEREFAAANT